MLLTIKASEDKKILLDKWTDMFYKAYPLGSTGFVRSSSDEFANPVGSITIASLDILFDAIIGKSVDPQKVQDALIELIQLRAIQKMSPSQAVGPLVQLKKIIKSEVFDFCYKENKDLKGYAKLFDEYFIMEARIDSLFLMALDLYAVQKEKVFNLRVEEIHRNQSQVVRWAKLQDEKRNNNHKTEG